MAAAGNIRTIVRRRGSEIGAEMSVALYDKLTEWARGKTQIAALHLFGARARGDHVSQSALLLALEFSRSVDEAQQLNDHGPGWVQEISALSGLKLVVLELRSNKDVVKLPIVTIYRCQSS